ncbi:Uncharacterised protein [Mycobacteroides abscessus subsp. abscessus]|nr:Uncharacterised protein [Mycobacteroides abscessus subsp. abscessus]
MMAMALTSSIRDAAASTAAPPRECPISIVGAPWLARMKSAAHTKSSTLELNPVAAKSPSESPNPVKSKRRTPIPLPVRAREIRAAAELSFPQVKQCANTAHVVGGCSGVSSRPDSEPLLPANVTRSELLIGTTSSFLELADVSVRPRCPDRGGGVLSPTNAILVLPLGIGLPADPAHTVFQREHRHAEPYSTLRDGREL